MVEVETCRVDKVATIPVSTGVDANIELLKSRA